MDKTIKNYTKKLVALCLTACLITISLVTLVGCNNETTTVTKEYEYEPPIYNTTGNEQKAIIILPGMFGSNLVDAKTEEPIWSGGSLMNNLFMTRNRLTMQEITKFFTQFMQKDEKGKAAVQIKAATMDTPYLEYGIIDEYKDLYRFFDKTYGQKSDDKEYQVLVYQYDWTKSARECAADLEKFITANNYKNNVLVGHSLGGIVIDHYLTSEENRTITDGFISLGTPHYGAMDTLVAAFAKPDISIAGIGSLIPLDKIMSLIDKMGAINTDKLIPEEYIGKELEFAKDLLTMLVTTVRTMPSIYDLLPSKELFNNNTIYIGDDVQTYDSFIEAAKLTESYVNDIAVQNALNKAIENRASLYTDGQFVTELFSNDTYYLAGNGHKEDSTTTGLKFTTDPTNNLVLKVNNKNLIRTPSYKTFNTTSPDGYKFTNYVPQFVGDGMVLVQSATCGRDNGDNCTYLRGFINHTDLYSPIVKTESNLEDATTTEVQDILELAMSQITNN